MSEKRTPSMEDFVFPEAQLIDDVDLFVTDAFFEESTEYDSISLVLMMDGPDLDEPFKQFWPCGGKKTWECRGTSLVHKKRPDDVLAFTEGGTAAYLVNKMFEAMGEGSADVGKKVAIDRGYFMIEADFFVGFAAHWTRQDVELSGDAKKKEKGETVKEREKLLPVTYYGYGGETSLGKKPGKAAAKPRAAKKDAEPAAVTAAEGADDSVLDDLLISCIDGAMTRQEVSAAIMQIDDFKANQSYRRAVITGAKLDALVEAGTLTKDGDKYSIA